MKNFRVRLLPLVICLIIIAINAQKILAHEKTYWEGDSDGAHVIWSTKDLKVIRNNSVVYSTLSEMKKESQILVHEGSNGANVEQDIKLLSIVGPFLSFRYHIYYDLLGADGFIEGAHPGGQTVYITIDMRKSGNPIHKLMAGEYFAGPQVQSIFSRADLINELQKDKVLKESLLKSALKDFASFKEALAARGSLSGQWCGSLEPQLLNAFCFRDIVGNRVAVRLGITGAGPCRENLTELGLFLPIPSSLATTLNDAKTGKTGCLESYLLATNPKALTKYSIRILHK